MGLQLERQAYVVCICRFGQSLSIGRRILSAGRRAAKRQPEAASTPGLEITLALYRGVTTASSLGMPSSIDVVTPRC
jgi:hypothetical protein